MLLKGANVYLMPRKKVLRAASATLSSNGLSSAKKQRGNWSIIIIVSDAANKIDCKLI
jgi:hypothetical protein